MILTQTDFVNATAFELYVLEKLHPVIDQHQGASIDLRGSSTVAAVSISVTESLSGAAVGQVKDQLAPLLFGAAWKVLDLLVEYALNKGGYTPARRDWSIAEKQRHALAGAGDYSVLCSIQLVWKVLSRVYANTVEHRHCLIHRTAQVNGTTGSLDGIDRNGQLLQSLTRDEQVAVAKLASLATRGAANGGIDRRSEDHLKCQLDQLMSHTAMPPFGVSGDSAPVEIQVSLSEENGAYFLDMTHVLERASKTFPTVAHFDVVVDVPDSSGRKLFAYAENCPVGRSSIDLSSLPLWLEYR